jgi:aquaporin Z
MLQGQRIARTSGISKNRKTNNMDIEQQKTVDPLTGEQSTPHDLQLFAYQEWKAKGRHLEEYACELIGTALLVMAVIGAVAVVQASGSPISAIVKPIQLRLLLTGFIIATSGLLITISPLGRLSGAHLNPAISLGFWMLGKLSRRDMIGYIVSQMAGAIVGAFASRPIFGMLAREVKFAAMAPGPRVSVAMAFTGELLCSFAMALAIYFFVSHEKLARWTPFMLVALIPFLVLADGTVSGCGMNPARWIGPAYIANIWEAAWIYIVGPAAGATLAVLLRKSGLAKHSMPVTAKLFHDANYRSLFKHDILPTKIHIPKGNNAVGSE